MSSLEQIKQLTKRKINGLFFIKNKHAIPNYKNHSYFEQSCITPSHSSCLPNQLNRNQKWSMFVKEPTDYGLSNTYQYLQNNNIKQRYRTIDNAHDKQNKAQAKYMRHNKERVNTEPGWGYIKETQSYHNRAESILKNKTHSLYNKNILPQTTKTQNIEHIIELTYIPPTSNIYSSEALLSTHKLRMDLFPFILKTFLKCRINYEKQMTSSQYQQIKKFIQEVAPMPQTQLDIKDLINLNNIQELFALLQSYDKDSYQWIQSIRYFFVAPEEIAAYQFQKMLDQLKMLTVLNFNAGIQGANIYVFRVEDRLEIRDIYGLLKEGTYIYGVDKNIIDSYEQIRRVQKQRDSYQRRIKRWRNVANLTSAANNLQDSRFTSNNIFISQQEIEYKKLTRQKFNKLYCRYKEKHKKYVPKTKSFHQSFNTQENSLDKSSFIDKSKLIYCQDIFQ